MTSIPFGQVDGQQRVECMLRRSDLHKMGPTPLPGGSSLSRYPSVVESDWPDKPIVGVRSANLVDRKRYARNCDPKVKSGSLSVAQGVQMGLSGHQSDAGIQRVGSEGVA